MRDQIGGSVKDGINAAISQGQNRPRRAQQILDDAKERVRDAAKVAALWPIDTRSQSLPRLRK